MSNAVADSKVYSNGSDGAQHVDEAAEKHLSSDDDDGLEDVEFPTVVISVSRNCVQNKTDVNNLERWDDCAVEDCFDLAYRRASAEENEENFTAWNPTVDVMVTAKNGALDGNQLFPPEIANEESETNVKKKKRSDRKEIPLLPGIVDPIFAAIQLGAQK